MMTYLQKILLRTVKFSLLSILLMVSGSVFAQTPANDNCGSAILVTSTLVNCTSPTNGTLNNSTRSLAQENDTPACGAAWTLGYDVWYRFTAVISTHTITTSNFGSNYWNRQIHIYSACPVATDRPSSPASFMGCGTTSVTLTNFVPGNTYYIRVSEDWTAITSGGEFTLCVTHPLSASNHDICTTAYDLTVGNSCTPVTANIFNALNSTPAGGCGGATATTTYDVWFRFQATATRQTITLSNFGASITAASTYIQTYSGTCGSFVSLVCNAGPRQTLTGLTVGTFYFIRVYRVANPNTGPRINWNFDICIQSVPPNDECTGAVILNSNINCTNTAGTLDLSSQNATNPLGCFAAGGPYYDVWYKFLAVAPTHTITLSSLGANLTAMRMQLYTGTCGSLTSVAGSCVSGSPPTLALTQTGLTPGTLYYVRVANYNLDPSGSGTVAAFNICVTHTNDLCAGATQLTANSTCTNITSTLLNATPTAGLPACGNSGSADVWFRFTASSNFPVITLSNIGADLTTANPRIQLFSGSCGALVPLACTTSPLNTATTPGGTGLSLNSMYYVRITTNTNTGTPTSGTWNFDICITNPNATVVDFAKSYINVTDGATGGTVNTGDVLEIRAMLAVTSPVWGSKTAIDNISFYDTLFANRGFRLLNDSMAIRTNEGKLFRPTNNSYYTDAADGDAAWRTIVGADTAIRINIGEGANFTTGGKIGNYNKPSFWGNTCIIMATYRVRVTAPYDTKICYGGGALRYRDTITGVSYTVNFPKDSLIVYASPASCPEGVSPTNIVGDEFNGTFGASTGSPLHFQNRTTANTKYAYSPFIPGGGPQDYFYSVVNNSSANGSTIQTLPKGNSARVFDVFDITGDHTGATNTAKGNPPCNLNLPVSASNPCGYMLAVNASYRTDVAFQYNVTGVCPDTYYEVSAWIKNICYRCGCDSNGVGAGTGGYIPTSVGDSSGVRPNLAFEINGVDYYSTGDLVYQGLGGTNSGSDTLNNWVRRAFVYKTKPGETSFSMSLRNNAPGGGGNDWAMDDIGIRTCYPSMTYSPSATPGVCVGSVITIRDTVRSFYDTYVNYKWQRKTPSGPWTDIAGAAGVATPVWNGSAYQYVVSYTLPPTLTTLANNGDQYHLTVATTAANLGSGCGYSDLIPITVTINNCLDIDDDNDGMPDYVETGNPVALQDANSDGIPNWNDATYAGRVDYNADGVDDRFDAGADADNDLIPNYLDATFTFEGAVIDINGDGVNDRYDKDLDGIINQYDLDSDNDGITDVVESYGADIDGNGIIDGYADSDGDGFSTNLDGSAGGVTGSGVGLGAQDLDGDGIPNYLDADSDNDGIPDVMEVGGTYSTNNGKISGFTDVNKDGISDNCINAGALLLTGNAINILTNGRALDFPNKNLDRDFRPNAYDMDSDGDGIADVIEAGGGITDTDFNGIADGVIGSNGWSNSVAGLMTITLRNTDASGNADYIDIDSDDDGIPDNVEGMSTLSYTLPTTTDADGDGLTLPYDNLPAAFGGSGIFVYDNDSDGTPDYRDSDTDNDGSLDVCEGNDWNLSGYCEEILTLTGSDTDGDGLDNRFDSLNSVTNVKGTSYRMGTGGTFTGDATPGARATVTQRFSAPTQTDRDWRWAATVLPVQFITFKGVLQNEAVNLNWVVLTSREIDHFEVERSINNSSYLTIGVVNTPVELNKEQSLYFTDNVSGVTSEVFYYKIKAVGKAGEIKYSTVFIVRQNQEKTKISLMPNPAASYVTLDILADKNTKAKIKLVDKTGRNVLIRTESLAKGANKITLDVTQLSQGVYAVIVETVADKTVKHLVISR